MSRMMTLMTVAGVVLSSVALSGCSGRKGSTPKAKEGELVGTWLEVPASTPAPNAGAHAAQPRHPNYLRQITFNADKTFKLTPCKQDGQPVDANKAMEGTWENREGKLVFQVKKPLAGYEDWIPEEFGGIEDVDGAPRCFIYHEGARIGYKKVK